MVEFVPVEIDTTTLAALTADHPSMPQVVSLAAGGGAGSDPTPISEPDRAKRVRIWHYLENINAFNK